MDKIDFKLGQRYNIRRANIEKLLINKYNGDLTQLAKDIKQDENHLSDIMNNRLPDEIICRDIEKCCNLEFDSLDKQTNNTTIEKKEVQVAVLNLIHNGEGEYILNERCYEEYYEVSPQILNEEYLFAKDCYVMKIKDDSMRPNLNTNDIVLITKFRQDERVINDRIYIFEHGNDVFIKRLQKIEEKESYVALSDKYAHDKKNIRLLNPSLEKNFRIIGQVKFVIKKCL